MTTTLGTQAPRRETGAGEVAGSDASARQRRRVLAFQAVGVGAVWLVVLAYIFQSAVPTNAVGLPYEHDVERYVTQVAPQGWAFFTRDSREPDIMMYARAGDTWEPVREGPLSSPAYAGFDRRPRALSVEMALLLALVPEDRWRECGPALDDCVGGGGGAAPVLSNVSPDPALCGRVAFVRAEPVAWAYATTVERLRTPVSAAHATVECGAP